jgi:hypothetical protein
MSPTPPPRRFVARLGSRWRSRRASAGLDLTRTRRHPEPDRRVVDPTGGRFVVRAVASDDSLEQQRNWHLPALLAEAAVLLIRAAYRAIRHRPQRASGFVVGVVDERPFLGGVVHAEPVALESGIAEKMNELSALIEAGDLP